MPVRSVMAMVEEASAMVTTLSVAQAQALQGSEDVLFVDLRDVRELEREGVLPGAFHAPRGMLEFWVDPASPYHKPVFAQDRLFLLFCAHGWRSALAARTLVEMGLPRVAHIAGGFNAWKAAGAPVAEMARKPPRPAAASEGGAPARPG